MARSGEKYRQAILYFVHECANRHLGRTKLMKLLYYLDFDHLERHRRSVTGDSYVHLQYGPVPEHARETIAGMESAFLRVEHSTLPGGETQHRFTPLRPYDLSVFTLDEVATLQAVAERWRDATRSEIVEASHRETPWLATRMGEHVPRHLAFHRYPKMPLTEQERTAEIESMLASFAMEGIDIPREIAERAFDTAFADLLSTPIER
jgi:uncharacterized phage-associated protein